MYFWFSGLLINPKVWLCRVSCLSCQVHILVLVVGFQGGGVAAAGFTAAHTEMFTFI